MGQRIEIPDYTSQWLAGDRFGEVIETQTKIQCVRGRVDEATGRQEEDDIVWVEELARVRLDGSGEVIEVPLADCFAFDARPENGSRAEIMEEFGRKPDEDGNWSEEGIAFLEQVCRERRPF